MEAEIFLWAIRYTGVSVLLDPALSATVAAVGFYFRESSFGLGTMMALVVIL